MNENLNLVKILDGCPKGTKLYSAIYGDVTLFEVDSSGFYPIRLSGIVDDEVCNLIFATEDGKSLYGIGECTLFPSKDQRDWSKFERFWDKPKVKKFDFKNFFLSPLHFHSMYLSTPSWVKSKGVTQILKHP